MQCDEITGKVTNKECPTPPPIYVDTTGIGLKLLFYILELIGLHGFVGFFCGTLLCCGCVRLLFGGVIFCRKSKAQEYHDELRKKGAHRGKGRLILIVLVYKIINSSSILLQLVAYFLLGTYYFSPFLTFNYKSFYVICRGSKSN